jgi:hypothetical protein
LVLQDGVEIGPRDHDKVPPLEGEVHEPIRGEVPPRFVPLNPADDQECGSRLPALNSITMELIGGMGKEDLMSPTLFSIGGSQSGSP